MMNRHIRAAQAIKARDAISMATARRLSGGGSSGQSGASESSGEFDAFVSWASGTVGLLGFALDGAVTSAGVMSFPPGAATAWTAPLWMTALWVNLATALNLGLRVLRGRYLLALGIGAVGGPLIYGSGASTGALSFEHAWGSVVVGAEFALALPLLVWANEAIRRTALSGEVASG